MFDLKAWLISPRDPLIFRNGKPFTAAPGSRAETLPMPFPGTLSGAVRTKAWTDVATGKINTKCVNNSLNVANPIYANFPFKVAGPIYVNIPYNVAGPILVELDAEGKVINWFFPAPADAVFFETSTKSKVQADLFDLKPMPAIENVFLDSGDMPICGFKDNHKEKAFRSPPAFWNWNSMLDWLYKPVSRLNVELQTVGIRNLPVQYRTHVAMDNQRQSAMDGALFQTTGIEFDYAAPPEEDKKDTRRFGLVVLSDLDLHGGGLGFLGGEKRMVDWEPLEGETPLGACPPDLRAEIEHSGFCRLILATPAYFGGSNLPTQALAKYDVEIKAMINNRFQTVSGWDYELKKPKPTRRLVPAGSVIFLKLNDEPEMRKKFIDVVWGKNIGDDLTADGYGLALLGTWDGVLRPMNMEDAHDQ